MHKVANLAQEVFSVECGCCVTFQLGAGVWGERLQLLCVIQLMVGPLNPVAPKLRQEDERKGAFSAQHLSENATQPGDDTLS